MNYSIFESEIPQMGDPIRSDRYMVTFYDDQGDYYKYSDPESNHFFPVKVGLPKQNNTLAKRWYFGSCRQDIINSDRSGETEITFQMRCDDSFNLTLTQFLGVPIGGEFLDEYQRFKHVEFNKKFNKIEIVVFHNDFKGGIAYNLYNCNVKSVSPGDLDASEGSNLTMSALVTYDTFDVASYDSSDRSDVED